MSNELDMSQYLDLFVQEAEEQLEILEQETLRLEEDPTAERMSAIFRAAHTLKGSSRAMGFSQFAGLTHEMENLLDALRSHQLQLSTAIANALLRCQDKLREGLDNIASGQGDTIDASGLIVELQAFLSGGGPVAHEAPAAVKLRPEILDAMVKVNGDRNIQRAVFTLHEGCVMKYVRAFMAINMVEEHGELLATIPESGDLEEENFEREFEIYFKTRLHLEEIQRKFNNITEVVRVSVEGFDPSAALDAVGTTDWGTSTVPVAPPSDEPRTPEVAEASPAAVAPVAATPGKKSEASQTVRVDVARLDELMNLVGELVIDRTRIEDIGVALSAKFQSDENLEALAETIGHVARITADLQDQLMKARMLPIETVFNRFPRMVRDLAQKIGKEIKLELLGGETELDRSVIEVIGDPLLHILRNAIDHGVELPADRESAGKSRAGQVTVSARHQENYIVIEITDDGRGINIEKVKAKAVASGLVTKEAAERLTEKEALQFIFASGLSTAEQVSEVSGRGVGMDIVRSNIQKLGGLIDLETTVGQGSKFSLRLPLTLAIIRGLLVRVAGVVYVLPLGSVVETLKIPKSEIQRVHRREVVVIRGITTPLLRLRRVFGDRGTKKPSEDMEYIVIVGLAEQRVGLVVDSLIGEQEVVIKSLNRYVGDVSGISGATILGNGHVALIVDVNGVFGAKAA